MWPMLLDMSRDDCKRFLRRLELEAYGSIVSALRAQGELNLEKRKILFDLSATLNISMERHKAEIRRAVNDEKLATVAEQMCGPNTMTEWAIEGRRLIPLLPRLVPQTAFTAIANNVANIAAAENAKLPPPSQIAKPKAHDMSTPLHEPSIPEATKTFQQSVVSSISPNLLASQASSVSPLSEKDEHPGKAKKRRRSSSIEGPISPALPLSKVKMPVSVHQHTGSRVTPPSQYSVNMNTVKITPCRSNSADSPSPSQKVIIVSTSSTPGGTSCASILQRSLSVPIVKPVQSCATSTHLRGPSMMVQTQGSSVTGGIASSNLASLAAMASSAYTMNPKHKHPMTTAALPQPTKLRPRIITPLAPQPPAKTVRATLQAAKPKYSFQMKDVSGVKMMAIGSNAAKILPKPAYSSCGTSSMYVMATSSATTSTAAPRLVPASVVPRVITVHTAALGSTPNAQSIPSIAATQPAKTMQKVHINAALPRPGAAKTNVIVVQKGTTSGYARGVTLAHRVKDVSRKLASSSPSSQVPTLMVKRPTGALHVTAESKPISQSQSSVPKGAIGNLAMLDQLHKTTALADIMQASGILMDEAGGSETTELEHEGAQYFQPTSTEIDSKIPTEELESLSEYSFQDETNASTSVPEEGRVLTLEEAIHMLGQSDCPETRAILSQSGIEVTDQQPYLQNENQSTEVDQSNVEDPIQHVVLEEDVIGAEEDNDMDGIGELDPQTGIYSVSVANEGLEDNIPEIGTKSEPSTRMDIFTTALASADINLDTFEFVDENIDIADSAGQTSVYLADGPSSLPGELLDLQQTNEEMAMCAEDSKPYAEHLQPDESTAEVDKNAVMVEPSHMDTTDMYMGDFASQKM